MTPEEFHRICLKASSLAVRDRARIGNLRLTQARGKEPTIREPEMLHAFCRTLDESGTEYGIEVPTDGLYRFVDEEVDQKSIKARHDLVLFEEAGPDVLVEFKREQPAVKDDDCPAISKDLRKLLLESANGKCMFHICHASDVGTLPALLEKYEIAYSFARRRVEATDEERFRNARGWLALYVLVLYDRNAGREPYLHRYTVESDGRFVPDPDGKVRIPRGE